MLVYLELSLIVVSITLVGLVLMQTKGTGLGSIFGGDGGVYQTRRGVERTLFNMTIVVAVLFLVISLLTVIVG
jgi:preprotein translocase subunit SecG